MAKKAILDVLESTIGKYVHNLEAESLNVALWSGKLELNSLQLNVDAVNTELARHAAEAPNLAIPFKIIDGNFESFQVDVHWAKITSKPVIFRAKGLSISIEPHDYFSEGCPVKDLTRSKVMALRLQAFERAEEIRKQANALRKLALSDVEDNSQKKNGFGAKLVKRIVENLQFEIDNVSISLRGCGCSAGIVLDSLSLVTTDENGNRTFVDRDRSNTNESFLYKNLLIKGLGIYCDEEKTSLNVQNTVRKHNFVMSPLSFQATLRQSDALKCVGFPKYLVKAKLSEVSIKLSYTQLELLNKIAAFIKPKKGTRPLFPEYRPSNPMSGKTARHWWLYAYRCIGRLTRRRSWPEFLIAFRKRKRYIPLYKRAAHHATCTWIKPLTAFEMEILRKIESDRSISVKGIMTWRNMADIQVEKEEQKRAIAVEQLKEAAKTKEKVRRGFRGSVTVSQDVLATNVLSLDRELPFSLSPEEIKELDAIELQMSSELAISSDSILCDINFTLGSYEVSLLKRNLQQLAKFEMGKVSTSFVANADGSFIFDFKLLSILASDKVTERTLFPSVIRSLQSQESSSFSNAIDFKLKKSRTGDQDILLKMVAFELVASPIFIVELRDFFTLRKTTGAKSMTSLNPMLEETVSGGYDLFYDANLAMDVSTTLVEDTAIAAAKASSKFSDKLSLALKDAWNDKKVKQSTWTVDCTIHAPIIIIPQNCSDADANVLVFDMGILRVISGRPATKVENWFKASATKKNVGEGDVDYWKFEMKNLSFLVRKAGKKWRKLESYGGMSSSSDVDETVIEPISITLDLGTDNTASEYPRTCIFGVLPAFSVQISPLQVKNILFVLNSCVTLWKKLKGDDENSDSDGCTIIDDTTLEDKNEDFLTSRKHLSSLSPKPNKTISSEDRNSISVSNGNAKNDVLYLSFSLRKLTAKFFSENGQCLEAHLVSVTTKSTKFSDGSSSNTLRMGWFWVLDRMELGIARRQRLFAHSSLPRSASSYAENDLYDILKDLRKEGVFDSDYTGSSELADISLQILPKITLDEKYLKKYYRFHNSQSISTEEKLLIMDAKFSSLFINWNPNAAKNLIMLKNDVLQLLDKMLVEENKESDTKRTDISLSNKRRLSKVVGVTEEVTSEKPITMKVNAQMKKVEISFNSAIDDLPLFYLTMAETKVHVLLSKENVDNMQASVVVGDIRVETAPRTTLPVYQTILGLAPNQSTSLLLVKYSKGPDAILLSTLPIDKCRNNVEAFCEVALSPMRFVHIQAQTLTLIEYLVEGVVAVLVSAITPVANASIKPVSAFDQVFHIGAQSLGLTIPQAANSPEHFVLNAANLVVQYRLLGNALGAEVYARCTDVNMSNSKNVAMVENPIKLKMEAILPPNNAPKIEDRTIYVNMDMSEACFMLTHDQYAQIMYTLDYNISEKDSFLRTLEESSVVTPSAQSSSKSKKQDDHPLMSHGGVEVVEILKRISMKFSIDVLGLQLYSIDSSSPIVSAAAVKTDISIQILPDQEKICTQATLLNLTMEDRRTHNMNRHFRSLIDQVHNQLEDTESNDVFQLKYTQYEDESKIIDLSIGSPQVVILPDVIIELIKFVDVKKRKKKLNLNNNTHIDEPKVECVNVICSNTEEIETAAVSGNTVRTNLNTLKCSLKTQNIRLVLVDMGNVDITNTVAAKSASSSKLLTETVVFQGKAEAQIELISEIESSICVSKSIQNHWDKIEIYVAQGHELKHPIQIVEPSSFAVHFSSSLSEENTETLDFKMVTLSPVDVIFSMQNAALFSTIITSVSDFLELVNQNKDFDHNLPQLSEEEAMKLKRLNSALQKSDWMGESEHNIKSEEHKINTSRESKPLVSDSLKKTRMINLSATLPDAQITIINDLQGLDQALFRVRARNVVCGGVSRVKFYEASPSLLSKDTNIRFDFHLNSTFLAEYFDMSTNIWEPLLLTPWEMSVKACRGHEPKFKSSRLMLMTDVESNSCSISFSEKFLVSLGAAHQMWSVYQAAAENAMSDGVEITETTGKTLNSSDAKLVSVRKSKAANAARACVTSMPYGINNQTGITVHCSIMSCDENFSCPSGSIRYFQFQCPKVEGIGGKRLYGQDVKELKAMKIFVSERSFTINHVDREVNRSRRAYELGPGQIVFVDVVNTGKATILNLCSHIHLHNDTNLPFSISVLKSKSKIDVGVCHGKTSGEWQREQMLTSLRKSRVAAENISSKLPSSMGVPINMLHSLDSKQNSSEHSNSSSLTLLFCPRPQDNLLGVNLEHTKEASNSCWGSLTIPSYDILIRIAKSQKPIKTTEILCGIPTEDICREPNERQNRIDFQYSLCIQVCVQVTLVDNTHPYMEVFLQPRCILENKLPISVLIRTPMPHTFSVDSEKGIISRGKDFDKFVGQVVHRLGPNQAMEIFTPGPSIAISAICADSPSAGPNIGWLDGEWIDLPLGRNRRLSESIRCLFPVIKSRGEFSQTGIEFFVSESEVYHAKPENDDNENFKIAHSYIRSLYLTVKNHAVDFIENLLFEPAYQASSKAGTSTIQQSKNKSCKAIPLSLPWSAFSCPIRGRRITLLPESNLPIRLIELTMEGNEGMKRSLPFKIEEIAISGGGVESSAILWEDNAPTGYYAYRFLKAYDQCEIRIIPEYIVFNGSTTHSILVRQSGDKHVILSPGKIAPIKCDSDRKLILMLEILGIGGNTAPFRVDGLGMKICLVNSNSGDPLGSIAVQTVVGSKDSKLVIKIGSVKLGGRQSLDNGHRGLFADDFIRFRVRWSEMQVNLNDTQQSTSVAQIRFMHMTVDYQRIFKDNQKDSIESSDRSQFALIIDNLRILDCDADSPEPIVLSSSSRRNFFELIVRCQGQLDNELVRVELINLNIAYADNKSDTIIINTSESFIWKLIDVANRVLEAINEMACINMMLDWDEDSGEFLIKIKEASTSDEMDDHDVVYKPPRSDKLFAIKVAKVSPIKLLVSFRRQPQQMRYKHLSDKGGGKLMKYFTEKLQFTIEKANISFDALVARNIKGPPDRVVEMFKTVYLNRIQYQMISLLSAVSLQDWKVLTSRKDGTEEYVEGDVLRLTGNVLGRSAGYVFKKVGQGLGDSVSTVTSTIGNSIEYSTKQIGIGVVGAGVNSVVSGLGDGVSDSVKGVSRGAGNIVRGSVRGVGDIVGGVGGGAIIAAKGVGKGVVDGDGAIIAKGINDGLMSVGNGVGNGVSGILYGAADGIMHTGQGLFSGVNSIASGIGGAFTGDTKKKQRK